MSEKLSPADAANLQIEQNIADSLGAKSHSGLHLPWKKIIIFVIVMVVIYYGLKFYKVEKNKKYLVQYKTDGIFPTTSTSKYVLHTFLPNNVMSMLGVTSDEEANCPPRSAAPMKTQLSGDSYNFIKAFYPTVSIDPKDPTNTTKYLPLNISTKATVGTNETETTALGKMVKWIHGVNGKEPPNALRFTTQAGTACLTASISKINGILSIAKCKNPGTSGENIDVLNLTSYTFGANEQGMVGVPDAHLQSESFDLGKQCGFADDKLFGGGSQGLNINFDYFNGLKHNNIFKPFKGYAASALLFLTLTDHEDLLSTPASPVPGQAMVVSSTVLHSTNESLSASLLRFMPLSTSAPVETSNIFEYTISYQGTSDTALYLGIE